MSTPTSDEMLDAIAEDVALGVKSRTTNGETTTLETPTERLEAEAKLRKARAGSRGFAGFVTISRAVPPGAGPQ